MTPAVNWRVLWPFGSQKFLHVDCVSGLGNRIKALVAGLRISQYVPNRVLTIGWEMDDYHCHCPLNLLFANPFLNISGDFYNTTGYIDYLTVESGEPNFVSRDSSADVVWVTEQNFFYLAGERDVMWGQHGPLNMRNPSLRDELSSAFEKLVFHPAIKHEIERFVKEQFQGRCVLGVHIRRGDNLWANENVSNELFPPIIETVLKRYPKDTCLFVCSDCPDAEKELYRHFAGKMVRYRKLVQPYSRGSSIEAVQDALIEMGILARTACIVRTPSSTFSQCAAWFGRIPTEEVGRLQHYW